MPKAFWQIWVDTGGTFTDCIALSPQGQAHRVKVLSSGALRGILLEKIAPATWRIAHRWPIVQDILAGYVCTPAGYPEQSAIVRRMVFEDASETAILHTNCDLHLPLPAFFELSAGEEAPILAARIATHTPLRAPLPSMAMRLGTTKGTNALLERKGAAVHLLVTRGFADLPLIGTQQRPHLFQLDIPAPEQLHRATLEVSERMDAQGHPLQPIDTAALEAALAFCTGADSVAVALLHSYRNAAHEQQLAEALRAAGHRYVSVSSELSQSIKFLPRLQTTVVNACLEPVLDYYLCGIARSLETAAAANTEALASTLHLMTSAGGLVQMPYFRAKDSLLSGPAGGVAGAAVVAESLGFKRVLTIDMGGTSTDCARYDGRFDYRFVTKVGQAEILSPALDIETVAAGGGSICAFDGQKLTVGPQSAGANPGPACYGAGGPLTITDVNLLLGRLDPSAMGIPISREHAQAALARLLNDMEAATGVAHAAEEVLQGLLQIADERMAGAIRRISVAKGFDPKAYALLAFGGAGGLHACQVAELLGISTVILPADAGLLSAYGIGHAPVERFAERQVLRPWAECRWELLQLTEELLLQVFELLAQEGIAREQMTLAHRLVRLRFQGQDSTLELDWDGQSNLSQDFEALYRELFGHFPSNRALEVESLRVVARDAPKPVLRSEAKIEAQRIYGPAMLPGSHAAAWIAPGWMWTQCPGGHAVLTRQDSPTTTIAHTHPIELELFTHRFGAIAEAMGAQLQRTAFSVNVKERLDFSCALLDAKAHLLVNAPHIPVHLGSLGICARLVLQQYALQPGDVLMTNHPRYGGSHLPDVTLLSAVYADEGTLLGYVINRAHHAEIGGLRPGSMPPDARTLEEEGVVIAPTYLVKGGEVQWAAVERLFTQCRYPTRAWLENQADLNAALAALRTGEQALQALARVHGVDKVKHYMQALQDLAADALEQALGRLPAQSFQACEYLDDGAALQVHMALRDGLLHIDFNGSAPTHSGNLNANISIVYSVVLYVLRLLVQKDIPLNEGLLRRVRIHVPQGCILNPTFEDEGARCPAVAGGNTEVSQRLTDTLLKALELAACSQGTMNNFLFGNAHFGYYETIGGGAGAGPGFAGRSAVHQHMTNTRITDPEELELRYPVRLWRFAIRRGSGGAGQWPGGDGIIRELEFLQAVEMTLLSQHRQQAPYGLKGGQAGQPGAQYLIRRHGKEEPLQGMESRTIEAGEKVRVETPGGGGWGEKSDK